LDNNLIIFIPLRLQISSVGMNFGPSILARFTTSF